MEARIDKKGPLRGRRRLALPHGEDVLLDAAKEVFLHKGVREGTLREIAKRAGLSSTMIYYHFGSKEGLVCELLRRAQCKMLHDLEAFCRAHRCGPVSNEVLGDLAVLLRRHLGEACILGWLLRDPGVQRYDRILEGLDEARGKTQDCMAAFLGWEPGAKRLRSSLDLRDLCRWAMSPMP